MKPTRRYVCGCGWSREHSTLILDVEARTEIQSHNVECPRAHDGTHFRIQPSDAPIGTSSTP